MNDVELERLARAAADSLRREANRIAAPDSALAELLERDSPAETTPARLRSRWRSWAAMGAAAAVVALVAGLAALGRGDLRRAAAPSDDLLPDCDTDSLILSSFDADVAPHADAAGAFDVAYNVIVVHATNPERRSVVPRDGWIEVIDDQWITYTYETPTGPRAAIRVGVAEDGYRPMQVAECVPGATQPESSVQTAPMGSAAAATGVDAQPSRGVLPDERSRNDPIRFV